eukprot:EG_transcript_12600
MAERHALPRPRRGGHPHLDVGQSVVCLCSADDCYHVARVLRTAETAEEERYYVHYLNQPTRLDEWITADRIDFECEPELFEDSAERKTRSQRRRMDDRAEGPMSPEQGVSHGRTEEHVKNIESIVFGFHTFYQVATWYYSPYPEAYIGDAKQLFICEFCLKYFPRKEYFAQHQAGCWRRHPPGYEVYRHRGISVYEVDGAVHKVYCQCLCLLARLFLEHKTLCFDVESFMFYLMLVDEEEGDRHLVGYFSKEKVCPMGYNLACILVLPPYQKVGYGRSLIQLAYELSRRTGIIGTPERPLSDLGLRGFLSYWKGAVLAELRRWPRPGTVTVPALVARTCVLADDVVFTLRRLGLLQEEPGGCRIAFGPDTLEQLNNASEPQPLLDMRYLRWPLQRCEAYDATRDGDFFVLKYHQLGPLHDILQDLAKTSGQSSGPDRVPNASGG